MIIVPILAPSCKLKLSRFSAKLRIQDGAECGNMEKLVRSTQNYSKGLVKLRCPDSYL